MTESTTIAARGEGGRSEGPDSGGGARCADPAAFLRVLHPAGTIFEVRAPDCPTRPGGDFKRTASGYFHAPDAAAAEIERIESDHRPPGIYVTLNPCSPALLARSADRIIPDAKSTTSDDDVTARRWLMLDIDSIRPAGVSATDAEMQAALDLAESIRRELSVEGWAEPLFGMSGNGAYLLYRVDLPNNDSTTELVRGVLQGLAERFDTEAAKIDRKTFNAARIVKVLGTTARKGSDLRGVEGVEDRPHRESWFIPPAGEHSVISRELLESVAATPERFESPKRSPHSGNGQDRSKIIERCRNYLARIPDAVSGDDGHGKTFRAACETYRFGLSDSEALEVLREYNAMKCSPAWSNRELAHKLADARTEVETAGEFGVRLKNDRQNSNSKAEGQSADESEDESVGSRIRVEVTADEHVVIAEALNALASDPLLYHRGGELVHIVREPNDAEEAGIERKAGTPRIRLVASAYLRERLAATCYFQKIVRKGDNERFEQCGPPGFAVGSIHTRGFWPPLRHLAGIVETPCLRPDGSVLDSPGYDAATGLLYEPSGPVPTIPSRPTRDDALAARDLLGEIIRDFPFDKLHHRSTWFAALLTVLARRAFNGPAPLFLFDANVRGSGKSLLTDTLAIVTTGRDMPRSAYPSDDCEMEKRITSLAIAGDPLILLDNIGSTFGGPALDAALTSSTWNGRRLGQSEIIQYPLRMTWFATGNNVILAGDTSRRICHCRLDSPLENPEERDDFATPNLLRFVRENRGRFLVAGLTILRAWYVAGKPHGKLKPWGSFDAWSAIVRNALAWIDLPDPGESRRELQEQSDRDASALRALFAAWDALDPAGDGLTTAAIAERLTDSRCSDARDTLLELCGTAGGKLPDSKSIGYVLRRFKGRVIGGRRLEATPGRGGRNLWRLPDGCDGCDGCDVPTPRAREDGSDFSDGAETSPLSPPSQPSTLEHCVRCGFDLQDSDGPCCTTCEAAR